jgi:hypothetical protein
VPELKNPRGGRYRVGDERVNVRRHFTDLFTPAELDTLAALNERVLRHLAEETLPEKPAPDEPALPH